MSSSGFSYRNRSDRTVDLDQAGAERDFRRVVAEGDSDEAIETLRSNYPRMLRSGYSTVIVEWLNQLPRDALLRSTELQLMLGQACVLVGDTVTATAVLQSLRPSIGLGEPGTSAAVELGLAHIETNIRLLTGDFARAREPIRALGDLGLLDDRAMAAGAIDLGSLRSSLALGHLLAGDIDEATVTADQVILLDNIVPPSRSVVCALGTRALAHCWSGDEQHARRALREGMPVVDRYMGDGVEPAYLHVAAIWIVDDDVALVSREVVSDLARSTGLAGLRLLYELALARASMRAGDQRRCSDAFVAADDAIADMIDPGFAGVLRARLGTELDNRSFQPTRDLTTPELRCLVAIARGLTRPEVAVELDYTLNTVKTHLRHAYRKLGARDRDDAIAKAAALGLMPQKS